MIDAMVRQRLLKISKVSIARSLSLAAVAALVGLLMGGAGAAQGAMTSTKLGPGLCETTGGGRFVNIPGFPGEKIDRRLLRDIRLLRRRYKIFITEGYSTNPVHSANGEHPIGLALDIAPDASAGGTWKDITALANWAEPRQNVPRPPFRWVGYDGDAGHGRGHHLHLSYSHSPTSFGKPARTVYTLRCPRPRNPDGTSDPIDPSGDGGGGTSSGGIQAGRGATPTPQSSVHPRFGEYGALFLAPVAPETGGVDLK